MVDKWHNYYVCVITEDTILRKQAIPPVGIVRAQRGILVGVPQRVTFMRMQEACTQAFLATKLT